MNTKKLLSLFLSLILSFTVTTQIFAENEEVSSPEDTTVTLPDACISVPNDATLYIGLKDKAHFMDFTEIEPAHTNVNEDTGITDYYFELTDDCTYNYRISGENYITYAGKFKKTTDFTFSVTEDMLIDEGVYKNTIDRLPESNSHFNVADIYLNINPQGFLRLSDINDTYQIVALRNWEAVDNTTNNYFLEPDFHYTVIDETGSLSDSVVTVDNDGLLTAVGNGVAIVLVTYDAINIQTAAGGPFFGAVWPENTGVFVVSVGEADSEIITNMTINEGLNPKTSKLSGDYIDAEHDVFYFTEEQGYFTFTPETSNCLVSVANPVISDTLTFNGFNTVEINDDESFTVPLTEGRNIVKITDGSSSEYQVISAKKVNITINDGEPVYPGDTLNITFDTLYHPANKLAGVYNMSALPIYRNVSGYEDTLIGGLPSQYDFAWNENSQNVSNVLKEINFWGQITYEKQTELKVPEDYTDDTFILSDGIIYATGFGDAYGNHRGITRENGKAPNFSADAKLGYFGKLPDIEIPIVIESGEPAPDLSEMIEVSFTLMGDEKHDSENDDIHTLKENNLTEWIDQASIKISKDSFVIDVIKEALNQKEIPYVIEDGSYIKSVNELSEFDNGTYSGWLYTLNGEYPELGISEQKVSDGDKIILHYTDDYTKENTKNNNTEKDDEDDEKEEDNKNKGNSKGSSSGGRVVVAPAVKDIQIPANTKTEEGSQDFADVKASDWYYDAVKYVSDKKIMNGTDSGFEPESNMTRAMLVTVLYRLENPASVTKENKFTDVEENQWYYDAVLWAAENNIVTGVSDTDFAPNDNITREQLAVIIYRYAGLKGYNTKNLSELSQFEDVRDISDWALDAVKWANAASVINGTSETSISPKATATRAQVAKILMNFSKNSNISSAINDTAAYIYSKVTNPTIGSVGGEWSVIGLSRSNALNSEEYFQQYYKNVENSLKNNNGVLHDRKYSEYSRVILALTAIGKNPENVAGYNLLTPLSDYKKTVVQGINGACFALIALDCNNYQPTTDENIRNMYIDYILERELACGGWALNHAESTVPDSDITGMVLQALSKYQDNEDVKAATNRALLKMSEIQNADGGFSSENQATCESSIQMLVALCELNISPYDERFVKNNKTILDNIMTYKNTDNGFKHSLSQTDSNLMTTEQALYALSSVLRFLNNQNSLYNMTDTIKQ